MAGTRRRLVLDTVLLGIAGALAARAFVVLLAFCQNLLLGRLGGYYPPGLPAEGQLLTEHFGPHALWLIPLATTVGGLLTGLLVYGFAPEAEGHGTDTAIHAFHRAGGMIRARVPVVKLFASAITIGSGGAAGREGPIALIAAGVGSVYGRKLHRSEKEIRILLLAGMAAGLSAIFRSPIGTAIFAIEVLYSEMEFEGEALFYTMLASLVAYVVNGIFVGGHPLFVFPPNLEAPGVAQLAWYILLGIAAGGMATLLPETLYRVRDLFKWLPLHPMLKPALGGLCVGTLGMLLPRVLAGGYGWIQEAIDGGIAAPMLLTLAFAKMVAFAFTIGSGGSGGVFGPSLYIGAMLGGSLAEITHQPTAAFAVVGMAAVFAGAARVPIATLLMVTAMTNDYKMFVPAGLAVMTSHFVQQVLSQKLRYKTLYQEQVPARADSPAHQPEALAVALRLLRSGVHLPPEAGPIQIGALVSVGVPLQLPDGKQIRSGVVGPDSSCVGKPIHSDCLGPPEEVQILSVQRGQELLPPHGDDKIREGDRIFAITSGSAWEKSGLRSDGEGESIHQ